MYAIETNNLTKMFKSFKAVDALNLKVPEGSIYGFLGPNGAGKTTTIKMLTGLSKPTAGTIKICNKEMSFGSIKNRVDIGFLPDVPNFYDWMTAQEFMKFSGELFSIDNSVLKKRIDELLELVGLSGVNKKIRGYSRGMKQRLGIAQALINNPRVVFLDEPTSALDPIGRKEVMDIVVKLAGKITVFFSTHILTDVERVCDRVVILNGGKMMIEDTISNLRKQYSRQRIILGLSTEETKKELADSLKTEKWVEGVSENENGELKINVASIERAQYEIPKILSAKNAGLYKFQVMEPSLEDIFLKVVNK